MYSAEKRIVVTGASGYVGRILVAQLFGKVEAILCIGQSNVHPTSTDLQFCPANLLQEIPQQQLRDFRPTHLIHLAWIADHGVFWHSPLNSSWVTATQKLLLAFAAAGGKHVTVTGTCAEYTWNETPCDEHTSETEPSTLYGQAKLLCLRQTTETCDKLGIGLAWARVFFPYGRQENAKRLIPQVYHALQKQQHLEVCGELQRDFLFIDDAAAAICHLALSQQNGVYNISSGRAIELKEVVRLMAEALSVSSACISFKPLQVGTQPKLLVGVNQRLSSTGWQEKFDISMGLRLVNQPITSGKYNE